MQKKLEKLKEKAKEVIENPINTQTNPTGVIERAKIVSEIVSRLIEEKKLYHQIQGRKYVMCEGWTTMGALFNLYPTITNIEKEKNDKEIIYTATCEIRRPDGHVLTRAISSCSNMERGKRGLAEFQIASMAQTRAVSKAFRLCLSWVMTLAGYEPTPAEEVHENAKIQTNQSELRPTGPRSP